MARESIETLVNRIQSAAQSPRVRLADLLPFVEHDDSRVRSAALTALWNVPCDATLQTLLRSARTDPDPEAQAAAVGALGRFIWSGMQLDEALDEQFGLHECVTSAQVRQARDGLLALFQDVSKPQLVRLSALEALSYDADEQVHADIQALWMQDSLELKAVALRCMGRTGHARWRRHLLEALHETRPVLLRAAIDAVGEGCVYAAEGRLLELAISEDRQVALAAIWALRNVLTTQNGRKALERLARSKDPEIKAQARAALTDLDAMDVEERGDDDGDD